MVDPGASACCAASVSAFTGEGTAFFDFDYNGIAVVYRKAAAPVGKSSGSRSVEGEIFVNIIVTVAEAVAHSVGVAPAQHFGIIKAFKRCDLSTGGKSRYAAHIGDLCKNSHRRTRKEPKGPYVFYLFSQRCSYTYNPFGNYILIARFCQQYF